jgi:hypothetical protein
MLEKLVLLLSVRYAIACHAITVTNYRITWCIVVINVMFNTVKTLSIIFEGNAKNKQMREGIYFELFRENYVKIISTGQIFFQITNYQGFQNNRVNVYEFFLFET